MAVAGPLDEAGVRSSVNGQMLAFTDNPTHRCTVSKPGPRFTTIESRESDLQGEDFLGKE